MRALFRTSATPLVSKPVNHSREQRRRATRGKQGRRLWRGAVLAAMALPLLTVVATSALAKTRTQGRGQTVKQLQRILDTVVSRLGIERTVTVVVVKKNPHVVSVEPPKTANGAFVVSVEESVLPLLSQEEIEAALAHEVGHVWVFTHHPFLQTEQLANQVAMRIVSRDALARVYEKVWKRDGLKSNYTAFLND